MEDYLALRHWPAWVFGWPAVLASIGLVAYGWYARRPWVMAAGVLLAVPFGWYINHYPLLRGWALAALVCYLMAPVLLRLGRSGMAFVLTLPLLGMAGLLAYVVASQ